MGTTIMKVPRRFICFHSLGQHKTCCPYICGTISLVYGYLRIMDQNHLPQLHLLKHTRTQTQYNISSSLLNWGIFVALLVGLVGAEWDFKRVSAVGNRNRVENRRRAGEKRWRMKRRGWRGGRWKHQTGWDNELEQLRAETRTRDLMGQNQRRM